MGKALNGGGGGFGGGGGTGGSGGGGGRGSTAPSNPGLVTSTGGLLGINGILMTPAVNPITLKSYIIVYDSTNFNCEENAQYTFRQEANYGKFPGEGRSASYHLIILKYRELGIANFSINITIFSQLTDDFMTIQMPVVIPGLPLTQKRKSTFPDGRIHTRRITPMGGVIQGERPQISITCAANSGPVSITKIILCGNADETAQQ